MTCLSCGTALPPGAKFCLECGTPTSAACSRCGTELPPGAKFCLECGTATATAAAPASTAGAVDTVVAAERRVTSVLFGDLVGFTTLSEARDPEEVRELLSRYFDTARDIVSRYGGTIEKFIGDAVMAVWGVPTAHEDDAERAVRAGLDLVDAVAAFGESVGAPGLALRVGIVTGEVAVTLGATDQGMVAGDAVNTAARVQSKAVPGTVWVDAQTRSLAGASIDFVDVGSHQLKGKAEPIALFAVRAVMRGATGERGSDRVQAPLVGRRRETQVVRDLLHATEESRRPRLLVVSGEAGVGKSRLAWELRKYVEGLSATVLWHWGRCLSYGSGVAFSALSSAVRGRISVAEDDDETTVRTRLVDTLAAYAPDAAERDWLEPRVAALLSSRTADFDRQELFAAWLTFFERLSQAQGEQLVWVVDDAHHADDGLLDFVEHLATVARVPLLIVALTRPELLARRPQLAALRGATVLGLDPLADTDAGALLDLLVEGLPPEVRTALVTRAEGNPLYAIETVRSMHDQGLAVDGPVRTPGALRLADGVTAEQLRTLAAPASLQVLVSSRLDLLPEDQRAVLATAAVLGQTFTLRGLATLTGAGEDDLQPILRELINRDLLTRITDRLAADEGQYAFVQAVVRTVAYQTQAKRDRMTAHLAAVDFLRPLADGDGEVAAVIAEHLADALVLATADDPRRPDIQAQLLAWLERSARRATAIGAPAQAIAAYGRAVELAEDPLTVIRLRLAGAEAGGVAGDWAAMTSNTEPLLAGDEELVAALTPDDRARAVAARARALRAIGKADVAWELIQPYRDPSLLAEVTPPTAAGVASQLAAVAYWRAEPYDVYRELAVSALSYAERAGEPAHVAMALNSLAIAESVSNMRHVGAPLLEHMTAFCREHHLSAPLGFALCNRMAQLTGENLAAAIEVGQEALELSEQIGDSDSAAYASVGLAGLLRVAGRWDEIAALWQRPFGDEQYGGLTTRAVRSWQLGLVAYARDEPGAAAVAAPSDAGDAVSEVWATAAAALAKLCTGSDAHSGAVSIVDACARVLEVCGASDDNFHYIWPAAVEIALEAGDAGLARRALDLGVGLPSHRLPGVLVAQLPRLRAAVALTDSASTAGVGEIEQDLGAAVAGLDRFGAVPDRARAQAQLGVWFTRQGRADAAAPLLDAARATYVELGAHRWERQLDAALAAAGTSLAG